MESYFFGGAECKITSWNLIHLNKGSNVVLNDGEYIFILNKITMDIMLSKYLWMFLYLGENVMQKTCLFPVSESSENKIMKK